MLRGFWKGVGEGYSCSGSSPEEYMHVHWSQGDLGPNLGSNIMSTWSLGEGLHFSEPQFSHL